MDNQVVNVLDGAKTFLGGLVLIGGGIVGAAFGVIDWNTASMAIGAGLSVWGLGQKIEKLTKATKANAFDGLALKETTTTSTTQMTGTKRPEVIP